MGVARKCNTLIPSMIPKPRKFAVKPLNHTNRSIMRQQNERTVEALCGALVSSPARACTRRRVASGGRRAPRRRGRQCRAGPGATSGAATPLRAAAALAPRPASSDRTPRAAPPRRPRPRPRRGPAPSRPPSRSPRGRPRHARGARAPTEAGGGSGGGAWKTGRAAAA